jgi:subtilisin family serine protease
VRSAVALSFVCAALASALPATAALTPIRRDFDGTRLPRVRTGRIHVPAGHAAGLVRVIARLRQPPLAAAFRNSAAAAGTTRRLTVASSSSRAYIARLAAAQRRDAVALVHAIPSARIGLRFRILLDGLTVTLPARRLPQLARLGFVTRVYPSLRYTEELNRSPAIIGADVIRRTAGADGRGIAIGVVDDGIDQRNRFFDPSGFTYPPGFPRGRTAYATPKVIVARSFPGPGSGKAGRLPVDPATSFHGTHVAGIAAGDEGTTAPAGADHPEETGLSGIAPKAWLGNYRVFTVPTPDGNIADTPEIVAAFESAVADGMDVINFSGGGPQTEPANDALVETIRNVVAAGVVAVIAAGNDRDDYGLGSVGSPGTAPDSIDVAAVSSAHVFAPALRVTAAGVPSDLTQVPFLGAGDTTASVLWGSLPQQLVDVGSITGVDGKPVDRHLCGPPGNLASVKGRLPPRSLNGAIALVTRGLCPFETKAAQAQAAGAIGLVVADNREGEANEIPLQLPIAGGMISNLDGRRLVEYTATTGGRTTVQIGHTVLEDVTGRSGVVTSFSSAGPTAFGHLLKPDVAAPGGQILSSTLANTSRSGFAVFDGTSMATPHVAGAAALLLQLHPSWSPAEVKSALVSTAGPAWADTARTQEAPVTLEGGGLVYLPRAADPLLFTAPSSLSFGDLDTTHADASAGLLVRLDDAGGGGGTWTVELQPQSATGGASIDVPGTVSLAPGGETELPVVARARAGAPPGVDDGFVVLRRGDVTRRIPYLFVVRRPALAAVTAIPLRKLQPGDTRDGENRVETYSYPSAPFGNAPDEPPMVEDGAERLYVMHVNNPAANAGVAVISESPGAQIDPFLLGSPNEQDVQGFAGTPVDVNDLTTDSGLAIGAAGASFPRQQALYVAVDSGRDELTGRRLAGRYVLRSWINDVTPPSVHPLTRTLAAGRPTIVARIADSGAGVDPFSLTVEVGDTLVGASDYDPTDGVAVFPLPVGVKLAPGRRKVMFEASDFEEAKNVNTVGGAIMPNTRFARVRLHVVGGRALPGFAPTPGTCVRGTARLLVTAGSPRGIRLVRFLDDGQIVGADRRARQGLFSAILRAGATAHGRHELEAVAIDRDGRGVSVRRMVRVCRNA